MRPRRAITSLALALTASISSLGAQAADTIELKIADSFPDGHYLVELMLKPWMADVTKRTNGKVKFSYFPNQQLGKASDMLNLTQSGVVDIGYIAPAYTSDKMPLSAVVELPGQFTSSCVGAMAYWKMARGEGILDKDEYQPNGIRLVLMVPLPPYKIFTSRQKISSVGDISGLKLRSTGSQDITARSIGAVPVRMSAPDAYQALSRGTLDGLLFPDESISSYGLTKLVKHATVGTSFGSFIVAYSIRQDAWNHLPDDVKQAIDAASEAMEPRICKEVDEAQATTEKKLQASGVSYDALPAATAKELQAKLQDVSKVWAEDLDKRGKPGTSVLQEFEKQSGAQKTAP